MYKTPKKYNKSEEQDIVQKRLVEYAKKKLSGIQSRKDKDEKFLQDYSRSGGMCVGWVQTYKAYPKWTMKYYNQKTLSESDKEDVLLLLKRTWQGMRYQGGEEGEQYYQVEDERLEEKILARDESSKTSSCSIEIRKTHRKKDIDEFNKILKDYCVNSHKDEMGYVRWFVEIDTEIHMMGIETMIEKGKIKHYDVIETESSGIVRTTDFSKVISIVNEWMYQEVNKDPKETGYIDIDLRQWKNKV